MSFSDRYLLLVRRRCYRKLFYIFVFFSRTTGPISTKLSTNYPLVKQIMIFFINWRSMFFFPRGNNNKIAKKHWQNSKSKKISKSGGPSFTKLDAKHSWVKEIYGSRTNNSGIAK